jgi:6-phosphogluconolactonase
MFVYVGSRTTQERSGRGEGISVYDMDSASGNWTHVHLVTDLVNPSFLTFDRQQRFLYTVHGDFSEASAFKLDQQTGHLTFLNQQSTAGANPVHLIVDPTNRFLIVANYATGTLAVLPINPDGSLGSVSKLAKLPGNAGPHKIEQVSSHPHQVSFDRTGRFIVVPDKGLDRVFVFRLDGGKLVPNEPPWVDAREASAPRHIGFHPGKPYAYVINELDSTVTTYRYNAERGELKPCQIVSTLPPTFTGNSRASEIAVAERFVYGSNRGHDSIAIFLIDQATGMLSSAGWESTQGKTPRFFALDSSGKFLYAANENSDTIVTFRIDQATGKLAPTGQVVKTGSPVCIVFAGG